MLRIDLSLVYNVNPESNCCAHLSEGKGGSIRSLLGAESDPSSNGNQANFPQRCGDTKSCCGQIANASQCDVVEDFGKITFDLAKSNKSFFHTFVQAWKVATENGTRPENLQKLVHDRRRKRSLLSVIFEPFSLAQCKELPKLQETNQCNVSTTSDNFFPETNDLGRECFWQNTNYLGFDVKKLENIPTPNRCQLECTKVKRCKHWSFDSKNKRCFLKKKNQGRVSAITEPIGSDPNSTIFAGWVSGPKKCKCVHKHLIFNGKKVQENTIVQRKKDCRNQCKNHAGCLNFSWSKQTKECKLLANITSVAFDQKGRSGPKSCVNNAEEDDSEEGEEGENLSSASFQRSADPVASVNDLFGSSSGISIIGCVLAMFFSF
jgi:hypothetical protein